MIVQPGLMLCIDACQILAQLGRTRRQLDLTIGAPEWNRGISVARFSRLTSHCESAHVRPPRCLAVRAVDGHTLAAQALLALLSRLLSIL